MLIKPHTNAKQFQQRTYNSTLERTVPIKNSANGMCQESRLRSSMNISNFAESRSKMLKECEIQYNMVSRFFSAYHG